MSTLESALIVVVPEAAPAVDAWREQACKAKPSAGVPPHITLLYPFVPAGEIDDTLVDELGELFARFAPFSFALREARRFPGALYLSPEPGEPFVALTKAIATAHPDYPPYAGTVDSIVPHLTVAEGDDELLDEVERDLAAALPIGVAASEVLLLEEVRPDLEWRVRARLPIGGE